MAKINNSLDNTSAVRRPNREMRRNSKRVNCRKKNGTIVSTWARGIQPEGISPEVVVYGEYCANRRRGSHK